MVVYRTNENVDLFLQGGRWRMYYGTMSLGLCGPSVIIQCKFFSLNKFAFGDDGRK